mmetsp:Transcript_81165/g.225892  ORF Transcript_81165/g.225892 Transcript_81165/m.225892 type:complete len:489 (-) Transcript_81165:7-1473(-)
MAALSARVCIVGGGAAGFYSAIACAEAAAARFGALAATPLHGPGVLILEQSAEVLRKVRISGGGRCNVTHGHGLAAKASYPRGDELISFLERQHGPRDTMRWFEARGVPLKTESDGRVFPASNRSASVVHCLQGAAEELGVQVRAGAKVVAVEPLANQIPGAVPGARFRLTLEDDAGARDEVTCNCVIFCCGSAQKRSVKRLLQGVGATLRSTVPSLFSLLLEEPSLASLGGLEGLSVPDARVKVLSAATREPSELQQISLPAPARGPLLITHTGLSGPAILRLSAWGAYEFQELTYRARLRVHWAPCVEGPEDLAEAIRAVPVGRPGVRQGFPVRHKAVGEVSPWPGSLPARLWRRLLEFCGTSDRLEYGLRLSGTEELAEQPWRLFERPQAARILARAVWPWLSAHELAVDGRRANKEEFVTAGGVVWREGLDWKRMELEALPGVHFAGEVLDVDGITGGFNFQGCWSTGFAAGSAAADAFRTEPA